MNDNKFEVKIRALTPIWTGGVDGKCDRLHETGIIGSMRWWYEAVVRGLGGYACDPTGDNRCELSGKEKTQEERLVKLCPVCYLFGCGGWKRRFRLDVRSNTTVPFQIATLEKNGNNYWWLSEIFKNSVGANVPFGEISLSFRQRDEDAIDQVNALLSIMAHIGAIGSKTQYGFGQFDWNDKKELSDAIDIIRKFLSKNNFKKGSNDENRYSLAKFWHYELSVPSDNELVKKFTNANLIGNGNMPVDYLPVSFDIRYKMPGSTNSGLRDSYYSHCLKKKSMQKQEAKQETRSLFGTLENDKIGSRVFVSHPFKKSSTEDAYYLKVWGFTDDSVGKVVGSELENMFRLDNIPSMINGKHIINMSGGGVQ